jgi:hypothetical protein
VIEQLVKAQ